MSKRPTWRERPVLRFHQWKNQYVMPHIRRRVSFDRVPAITRRLQHAGPYGSEPATGRWSWRTGFALRLWDHRVLLVTRRHP